MSAESNKQLIRDFYSDVWHAKGQPQFDKYLAANLTDYRDAITGIKEQMPDIHWTLEQLISEGDLVAERWSMTGTHKASGEKVTGDGMTLFRVQNGKIVDHWAYQATEMIDRIRQLQG